MSRRLPMLHRTRGFIPRRFRRLLVRHEQLPDQFAGADPFKPESPFEIDDVEYACGDLEKETQS